MFKLPEKIEYVLKSITNNGFEAYIVGGCVRDMLMGKAPHDFDITTSAMPEEIQNIFEKTVPTGIKHGTVTVIIEGEPIEVTTFRYDGDYTDCRHPEKVEFVRNIEADLSRRDFTVNAIAYNPTKGIVDLFGGIEDINSKILRAVGNPEKRFSEDALRIMRLFRFASILGFEIEKETLDAALLKARLLEKVSIERINSELCKLLCGEKPEIIETLIKNGGLIYLGIENTEKLEKLKNLPNKISIRLFAFLKLTNCDFDSFLNKFKASNQLKAEVLTLDRISHLPFLSKRDIKEILNLSDEQTLKDYLDFVAVFSGVDTTPQKEMLKQIISLDEPYKISHLDLDGNDLKEMGIKGEEIGERLEYLRRFVIEFPEGNKKEKLLEKLNNNRN
ncbi:MAG: CCA tRNA nucleotidyltransferase [Clostridia bacterium]|nr:CCA tRNA nucleotidyltransferase [Clostridia bacterium]